MVGGEKVTSRGGAEMLVSGVFEDVRHRKARQQSLPLEEARQILDREILN